MTVRQVIMDACRKQGLPEKLGQDMIQAIQDFGKRLGLPGWEQVADRECDEEDEKEYRRQMAMLPRG